MECVYLKHNNSDDWFMPDYFTAQKILKVTEKRVYVEPYLKSHRERDVILERATLEAEGVVYKNYHAWHKDLPEGGRLFGDWVYEERNQRIKESEQKAKDPTHLTRVQAYFNYLDTLGGK